MVEGIRTALIVGGGIGGMATAIALHRVGIAVTIIDIVPDWRVLGSGITLMAPTLRAYKELGFYEAIKERGTIAKGTRMRRYTGEIISDVDEPPINDGVPTCGGIMRPILHDLMADEIHRYGIAVRLGLTIDSILTDYTSADVAFSDGTTATYDLVVGADGIFSKVRSTMFPHAGKPIYAGQAGWRILCVRPQDLEKIEVYVGYEHLVGITPCARDKAYLWMNRNYPEKIRIDEKDQPEIARELLSDFGGNVAVVREAIGKDSSISYRPFETILVDPPWHNGRVVLVGDSCHATTPQLASGAGIAIEDAIVLAQELDRNELSVDSRLANYTSRRIDRCRFVVRRSLEICEAQKMGATAETGRLLSDALHLLSKPI